MIGYACVGTNDFRRAIAFYDALFSELGATDDGPPGDRGDNYYGAYFRDLDGNKLNFHCYT